MLACEHLVMCVVFQNNPGGSAVAPQNSSIPVTGVVIDTVTNQPSLTSPSSATTVSNSLSVVYVLTEDMQSVTLKFAGSSNFDIVMQGAALTTGTKTFSLDLNTPTSTSGSIVSSGSTVTDGTYTLSVQAVDSLGNAANSSAGVGVTVDRVTTAPVVSKPVSGSNFTSVDSNLDVDVTFVSSACCLLPVWSVLTAALLSLLSRTHPCNHRWSSSWWASQTPSPEARRRTAT